MALTLIRNAAVVATMDDAGTEIAGGAVAMRDGVVLAVGTTAELAPLAGHADEIVDATGCVVTPGLVNTHHHLYQTLTRALPGATEASLFGWLKRLYPIWATYTPDDVFAATQLGLAELALSGCTMSSDHLYLFPNGVTLDDTIHAADGIGLRFHATRGSMSVGESAGGLPPDSLVEREDAILADCIRVIDRFHHASDGAMVRVGVAPCSPFSVSQGLMRDAALLAREKGVMLHTHLAEDADDVAFSLERFGCRPGQYAEELGWTGPDVWHAHCVQLDTQEIDLFARTRTGVAHCPGSNCRLGSGIAPVRSMVDAGVKVGLGVDGSASNDSGNLLGEARQAMLLQRVTHGATAFAAREALRLATRGGAEVLGRSDLGSLTPGKRADCAVWDMAQVASTGAWDLVAGLVLAPPSGVRDLFVEGRAVVRDGELVRTTRRAVVSAAQKSLNRLMALA
ncbi:MAG: 8-oxoguanine deaminase [Novosphingobium sp. 28-62-57]|uniref:8-oxoguanine deaminase n=1 Tax=unclassified Novosphingobium TaxID=2644732 RepID=UPI000BC63E8D|nr:MULTISPECIES: 8-oxoguanine deaminase [unclassified Novosphingobium]OYW49946.1 MAG: 8-oxoguanine deaminase [Novosphingobium sp. 12-62-10]OYZ12100.1 MAG: 8-oxoguanine deaminase [Novosphingobium sp. 28-62-57]OZA39195.1 MAG: 8-oxoguanine deaminase [Novosphingobium sp. 17-62-9]